MMDKLTYVEFLGVIGLCFLTACVIVYVFERLEIYWYYVPAHERNLKRFFQTIFRIPNSKP